MTKGPQCNFAWYLMSMKTTLNVLKTDFHFVTSYETCNKRNLVLFSLHLVSTKIKQKAL